MDSNANLIISWDTEIYFSSLVEGFIYFLMYSFPPKLSISIHTGIIFYSSSALLNWTEK